MTEETKSINSWMERIPNTQVDCQGQMNWLFSYQMEFYQAFSESAKLINTTSSIYQGKISWLVFWSMKLKIFDKLEGEMLFRLCVFFVIIV